MPIVRPALVASAFLLLTLASPAQSLVLPTSLDAPEITLQRVGGPFRSPILATHAGDGSGRLFVVEQTGGVKVVGESDTWLDLTSKIRCCGERGLLGLEFAPDFDTSKVSYVSYSRTSDGAGILERLVGDPPVPDGEILLVVPDIAPNHNGGMLAFGPDGMLYWSQGDGGGAGDPVGAGQRLDILLGKMLRLDVSGTSGYRIPSDNPFVGVTGARAEIWAYGLRNPWRFSFDRATGDMLIGDVGQNVMEEIDFQPAASTGGENYGWNTWEGVLPYPESGSVPDPAGKTFPVMTYLHQVGTQSHCSVTGGYVYRGSAFPALDGWYLFGDYCSGAIWAARSGVWEAQRVLDTNHFISSFGEDEAGEVYVTHLGGAVYRVVAD